MSINALRGDAVNLFAGLYALQFVTSPASYPEGMRLGVLAWNAVFVLAALGFLLITISRIRGDSRQGITRDS